MSLARRLPSLSRLSLAFAHSARTASLTTGLTTGFIAALLLATAANAAHGPGIPEDRIAAAMKPFVRLDAARGGEGHSGLGLAIVVRLAHHRGGQCVVANHPEGGLHVRIALPAAVAQA